MTLGIGTITSEGIVLATDSRQSYRNRKGISRIGSDNATKLFQLNKRIGLAIAGLAFIVEDGVPKNISKFIEEFKQNIDVEKLGVKVTSNIDEALKKADAINVLRMQFERDKKEAFPSKIEYFKTFGITEERLKKAKKDIVVMHPGPINRGLEMSAEVADGANSVILEQVTNGIAVRMAVLYLVAHAKKAVK